MLYFLYIGNNRKVRRHIVKKYPIDTASDVNFLSNGYCKLSKFPKLNVFMLSEPFILKRESIEQSAINQFISRPTSDLLYSRANEIV
jgi:hypothetical protein